ncbi:MAG: hypothetical protein U1E22_09315 [Coriobacteriia bacterium]|nr:hypothetical protein [Coriobacteriia bacterium]
MPLRRYALLLLVILRTERSASLQVVHGVSAACVSCEGLGHGTRIASVVSSNTIPALGRTQEVSEMMYQYADRFPGHMFRGDFFSGGGVILMGLGLIVIVGLIIWLVVAQSRPHTGVATHPTYASTPAFPPVAASPVVDPAETIARERLARGEIDAEEFQRIAAALRSAR